MIQNPVRVAVLLTVVMTLAGCAAERLNSEGRELIDNGRYEEGVSKLEEATRIEPGNLHLRTDFLNKREGAINRLLLEAEMDRSAGKMEDAEKRLRRVLVIDSKNVRASNGLIELNQARRHQELVGEARELFEKGDADGAWLRLRQVASEDPSDTQMLALRREIEEQQAKEAFHTPTLKSLYKKPVTLEFRDANLKMVFDVLSRTSGINFVFDKAVRSDLTTTIFVKRASLEDVVDLLLTTSQLEKKVLNSNSVLIYPNTPEKVREYQDLVVKSFYLENADVKQTANLLKTLLKTREIFIDEKLNLMVMRDTPETIRLAEKMIAMHDLAEPEVMLEVEVLEVTRTRLLDLGIKYPNQLTLTPLAGTGTAVTLKDLKNLGSSRIGASAGNLVINAANDDSDVNLLANPRIRARNREKAKIMIGDRVPVITTTSSATGFVADSVQYVDVGLKLEVEPNIYLKNEVAIKVAMEVSSIVNQVKSANGTLTYQIGSRNASTVLRLRDGETQVLAGLINDSDRASANKIPGLGDLPLLGRLFSSHRSDKQKTEIVLSITPHLVRRLERPSAAASEFWSGSETNLRMTPLTLKQSKSAATAEGSKSPAPTATPEAGEEPEDNSKAKESPSKVGLSWDGPKTAKVGETFQLGLKLKSDGGLRSMPFQVAYDPSILKVVEVSEGDFFKQDNGQTNFASNIDVSSGKIFVGVTRSGMGGAAGEHTLARITFKSLAESPKTDVKLLTATPVGVGNKVMNPELPDPYAISVGK